MALITSDCGAMALITSDCVAMQVWMDQHMKLGRWHKINGRALKECTVGIVGIGA